MRIEMKMEMYMGGKSRCLLPFSPLSPQESVDLGEIMFSLCYLPTAGRMTLTVIKCRNLKAMDITGASGKAADRVWGLLGMC